MLLDTNALLSWSFLKHVTSKLVDVSRAQATKGFIVELIPAILYRLIEMPTGSRRCRAQSPMHTSKYHCKLYLFV